MRISKSVGAAVLVAGLALLVRWPGLGQFMTADEENWMLRSAGFYHNLFRNGDTGGTFMTTHPGATAMWLIGGPIVWQEQRVGFDIDTSNTAVFRRAATLPVALASAVLIGVATWLAIQLFGMGPGVVAGVLLGLEPYGVGMSQIAHLDALLALLMLNSVLAFLGRKSAWAGIFAGLAMATKLMPAMWLFVFFGAVLFWPRMRGATLSFVLQNSIRRLGFIFGFAMLVFYLAWPALWFTADLGRSFSRDVPAVITQEHVAIQESEEPTSPASFYGRTLLGRTTPFVLILSIAGILYPLLRLPLGKGEKQWGFKAVWLVIYAIGFLVMITFAAKKADRYALPALVALPVVAGWVLGALPFVFRHSKFIFATTFLLLIGQIWVWLPYTMAYNSPWFDVRPLSQQGWGEGLEAAAGWLNEQPDAEELYIASWYPGVTRVFFEGQTLSLSSRNDDRVGFVMVYRNMMGRGPDDLATNVLEEFEGKVPVYVVDIQGVPYVWVYDVRGLYYFPQHVGELYGERTVGQAVPVAENNWDAIEIGLATFSSRTNTQDVILHVRESLDAYGDVRTVNVNAREIQDSAYHRFSFEPIADSADRTFYIFLDSPTSRPGDAVTVRFADHDVLPGAMVKDGEVLTGRDIAYRLPRQAQQ